MKRNESELSERRSNADPIPKSPYARLVFFFVFFLLSIRLRERKETQRTRDAIDRKRVTRVFPLFYYTAIRVRWDKNPMGRLFGPRCLT